MHETTIETAVVGTAVPILTPRGEAALRLSEFSDIWDEFSPADRHWFAHWLNELLIDAVLSEPAAHPERTR